MWMASRVHKTDCCWWIHCWPGSRRLSCRLRTEADLDTRLKCPNQFPRCPYGCRFPQSMAMGRRNPQSQQIRCFQMDPVDIKRSQCAHTHNSRIRIPLSQSVNRYFSPYSIWWSMSFWGWWMFYSNHLHTPDRPSDYNQLPRNGLPADRAPIQNVAWCRGV